MKFKRVQWSDEAARGLDETLRGDVDLLREQVENQQAELWRIESHSWMLTRTEYFHDRKPELVVCCYKGKDLKNVTRSIFEIAKGQGFGSVRYHTQRRGLNRLIKDLGFEFFEEIYRRDL